jgi:cytochrome c peroxidase
MKPRGVRAIRATIAFSLALLSTTAACCQDDRVAPINGHLSRWNELALARFESPPLGLPSIPVPGDNPVTLKKIALGRKLFFDRRLSLNNTMSCAMCHIPEQGFTNHELSTPVGVEGHSLRRNAPTILNVAYAPHLFHDGRAPSLERQAVMPLLHRDEMANPSAESLITKVAELADYQGMFELAFGNGPSIERIAAAIASWERTLLAADSPFDRWRFGGRADALTAEQQQGFALFVGKAQCDQCHTVGAEHALFTDQAFHGTGIGFRRDQNARQPNSVVRVEIAPHDFVSVQRQFVRQVESERPADQGRLEVTQDAADKWRYKTPSLRNVAVTAPYMHDGSLLSLVAVVKFYNGGGVPYQGLDPLIRPLGLDDREVEALVAFLRSLTAGNLTALQADARSVEVGN